MNITMSKPYSEMENIPDRVSESEVLYMMSTRDINWSYMKLFKEFTSLKDNIISKWLNISVRTLHNYKRSDIKFKANMKEQLLLLFSLFKHGKGVFGSIPAFYNWLNTENFYFDGAPPVSNLNTVSGIRVVDDRLTAMEYGDNV